MVGFLTVEGGRVVIKEGIICKIKFPYGGGGLEGECGSKNLFGGGRWESPRLKIT